MTPTEQKLYDVLAKWDDLFVWDNTIQPVDYSLEPEIIKLVNESRKVMKEVKNG
jgi:hypothetical protein